MISGFMDFTCTKCRRRFGEIASAETTTVTCPHCKHVVDVAETMRELKRARSLMFPEAEAAEE